MQGIRFLIFEPFRPFTAFVYSDVSESVAPLDILLLRRHPPPPDSSTPFLRLS